VFDGLRVDAVLGSLECSKGDVRWCDYHADYYTAGDNTEMVAFIKQFEAANPGFTVKRDVVADATMESQELVEAAAVSSRTC